MSSARRDSSPRVADVYAPIFFGTLAASITEAVQTAVATAKGGQGARDVLLAAWQAFGNVMLPAMLVGGVVAVVVAQPAARSLARHLRIALVGPSSGSGAGVAPFAVLLVSALVGTLAGRSAGERTSANVAVTIAAAVTVTVLVVSAHVVALASRALAPWIRERVRAARRRWPRGASFFGWGRGLIAATLIGVALFVLLPPGESATVVCGVFGVAFGSLPSIRDQLTEFFDTQRGRMALSAIGAVSLCAPLLFGRVPNPVRMVVLFRAPVAGAILSSVRDLVDADHDGYSPILGGGDCNDHDASIHPKARDIPGNHIDEDCSGIDSAPFTPTRQAAYVRPSTIPEHPNVILVQMDALRPDHLGFAGYSRPTSPKMDRFRETATWFDHAYSPAPTTRFAMAMLFTGLEVDKIPQRRGKGVDFDMLPGPDTLAARLGRVGYDRVGYTISYVVQHIRGMGPGFRIWDTPWPADDWKAEYPVTATHTTSKALEYLGTMPQDGSKPYFLFLHYRCTHDPYARNDRWNYGSSVVDDYDSAISYCDDEIGRLLDGIDARGDKDNTAVIFFSDHGELFGEHGFTHHGNSVFQPDVRTLLLARIPGIPNVRTVHEPVSMLDIEPTVLSLAGAQPDWQTLGWNLLPLVQGGDPAGRPDRPIYLYEDITKGTVHHESRGVLVANHKYVHDLSGDMTALYDVDADPNELIDQSASQGALRDHLREMLESWQAYTESH